jgi:hypothetical protein
MTYSHLWDNSNKKKGICFENYTEYYLGDGGLYTTEEAERRLCEEFDKDTEMDRLILDDDGSEFAIVEIKSGQFNNAEQAQRLASLAKQENLKLVFATPDGTTENFSPSVLKVLNQEQCFVIQPDKLKIATQVKPTGIHDGLPPGCPISKSEEVIGISPTMEKVKVLKASSEDLQSSQSPMSNTQAEIAKLKNNISPSPKMNSPKPTTGPSMR